MPQLTHEHVQRWLDAYVEAWRSYDPAAIGELFAEDATYRYHPYDEPLVGRDAIVADWRENQDDPASWAARYEPWIVAGDRAVAIGESRYVNPDGSLRDLYFNDWLLRFDDAGRCVEYIEYFVALPDRLKAAHG